MSTVREKKTQFEEESGAKPKGWWRIALALILGIATGALALSKFQQSQTPAPVPVTQKPPKINAVSALGRLEPRGDVVQLSAPSSSFALEGARVLQLMVREGERVRNGDVVAILDSRDRALAALAKAKEDVKVSQANLAKVKAGAQTGEIEAQQATIARLQAELAGQQQILRAAIARLEAEQRNAAIDLQRYQQLYQNGAISSQELDRRSLNAKSATEQLNETQSTRQQTMATLQRQIEAAKATLNKIQEVRPVDVQLAQSEVDRAIAAMKQAQADLALAYVRAPTGGEILKIHTRAGEKIGSAGIAEMGRTEQMIAIAEVLEEDIGKIRLGQKAAISSENLAFAGELRGTVIDVGRQIGKQDALDSDPAADVDARVVEIKVGLPPEASQRVSGLTYAKVIVKINI
ncbi:HlyD family efflux transporter periplasmic adaptor subunit [Chroococcidiopsis sp. FACHB-1243]|uniref:HlyD family efflux transporter periplasmic adaptor subunit n=1 Tax=Chroococcidiopsis sp. [FACHB-1243] TaxID=2692781 RepID=UPI0017813455|nr:HlyD family efflux transporter periplasmic adaptor subunit [Chroococcidiopsis sp. [FACHB-1243]]MBD2305148.1 HlyD family efflux transporter periplasmic adaptor subunit [Chroococcidiopsis sp. [FACHB-1243]]